MTISVYGCRLTGIVDGREVIPVFPNSRRAAAERDRLIAAGIPAGDMAVLDAAVKQPTETAGEGVSGPRRPGRRLLDHRRHSCRRWSRRGDLAYDRASGTPRLIIQIVSWAIFTYMLIGLWAGYLLLADRSGREIGAGRPVLLTVRCGTIDKTFLAGQ